MTPQQLEEAVKLLASFMVKQVATNAALRKAIAEISTKTTGVSEEAQYKKMDETTAKLHGDLLINLERQMGPFISSLVATRQIPG